MLRLPSRLGVQRWLVLLAVALATAAGSDPATARAAPAPDATPVAGAPPLRTPHTPPRPGEVRVLTILQLGNFPYDARRGGTIPPDVLALSGLRVRLRGTVTPWDLAGERVTRFALTDGQSCCFGGPPRIQHVVVVHDATGMPLALADGWVQVEGVLAVREERADGLTTSIFTLEADRVEASHR